MTCPKVNEPKEIGTWTDNYLCLPKGSGVSFDWSYAGKIAGEDCTAFREGDATSFGDNYLCAD